MEDRCFGGVELVPKHTLLKTDSIEWEEIPKTRSAYMLIYERSSSASVHLEHHRSSSVQLADTTTDNSNTRQSLAVNTGDVPVQLLTEIWEDNMRFIREKRLFDPEFFKFILTTLQLNQQVPIKGTQRSILFINVCRL